MSQEILNGKIPDYCLATRPISIRQIISYVPAQYNKKTKKEYKNLKSSMGSIKLEVFSGNSMVTNHLSRE